mmetsp:Transcript_19946/g.28113  ORF Transcript_19946/g.28113 Transcript_19946/m.28113 type:complete len:145 (-) Transcript_19946:350-784(-)
MSVTVRRQHFEDTIVDCEERHIESTTTQIEYENSLLALCFVKTVRNGSRSWLVDDSHNVEASDGTSILGGLTLSIVEVGWDGHNGVSHFLAKVRLGDLLHLRENHSRDFFSGEHLVCSVNLDHDVWLAILLLKSEWEELLVVLH